MGERKEEIEFVIGMISKFCIDFNMGIYPKEVKGKLIMVIQDSLNGKEYAMINKK